MRPPRITSVHSAVRPWRLVFPNAATTNAPHTDPDPEQTSN